MTDRREKGAKWNDAASSHAQVAPGSGGWMDGCARAGVSGSERACVARA